MVRSANPKKLTINSLSKYKFVETEVLFLNGTRMDRTRYSIVTMGGNKFLCVIRSTWKKSSNPEYEWQGNYRIEEDYIDINRKDQINAELNLLNRILSVRGKDRRVNKIIFKSKSPVKSGRRIVRPVKARR